MLHIQELFSHFVKRPPGFIIPIVIIVCFFTHPVLGFGQCTTPSFAPATNFAAGNRPSNIAVGDFNGDGKRDLAVPDINSDSVSILLGNGAGSFTLGGSFSVGHEPTSAAAGDFNGDGKLDLAVVNYGSFGFGDMSILIGNGAGGFGAPTSYRVIAFNNSVTVSDLNNDGKLDIVAGTYSEQLGNVKVLLGDGAGAFSAFSDFGGNADAYSPVVGDFNGDGNGDVAVAKNTEFAGGNYVIGTAISVLLGDGSGRLGAATNYTVGTGPTSMAVGDLNGDGKLDLAVANAGSDNLSILLGDGVGGFGAATNFAVGDFPNFQWFPPPQISVAVGDFNGDGKPDLAVSHVVSADGSGTVSVLLGNGTGGFSSPTNFVVGTRPVSVVVSDFNGDSKKDLAIANYGSNDVSILINTCSSAATNPIDDAQFFVRQHYRDFLNRDPDSSGLAFWTNEITSCGSDSQCTDVKRINVSASFFLSIEFQQTGYLVERIYKAAYGDATGTSNFPSNHQLAVPAVRFNEFLTDTERIGQGVIVLQSGWEQLLESNKQAYAKEFVQTSRFISAFPATLTPADFVDKLNQNGGSVLSPSERTTAINYFAGAGDTSNMTARAQAVRQVAEDQDLYNAESNRAFVLAQYFGYLQRNPNDAPESTLDYTGFDFWLTKLNQFNGNYIQAEMVKAFLSSSEYRHRFGP
jgi:FG-GAP-like repeat